MSTVKPIPEGYRTITPHLVIRNGEEAIEFYKKAFGAEVVYVMPGEDGKGVMHASLVIGDSRFMIADEMPHMERWLSPDSLNGTTMGIHLYVEDADAAYQQAIDAGATSAMEPMDTFWGDRYGMCFDPYGHAWTIATHKEDLTPEQMDEKYKEWKANC